MTTPVDVDRRVLERRLRDANAAIDKALDTRDRATFFRACGLRLQLLSRIAKTHDS